MKRGVISIFLLSFFTVFGLESKTESKGNFLIRSNGGAMTSIAPYDSTTSPDHTIKNEIWEGLTAFGPSGEIVPGVAYKWDISPDKLTYTFYLRSNAKWSNGDPVTAHDFVFAFRRLVDPNNGCIVASLLAGLKNADSIIKRKETDLTSLGVKALDDYTLQIQLENPLPYILELLASYPGYPLHQKTIEKYGADWTKPGNIVSNGPFVLKEMEPNDYIKLVKNEHYWDKDVVKIDGIYFLFVSEESVEFKMFRTGKIDITHNNFQTLPTMELMKKKAPETVRISPALKLAVYIFSMKKQKVADPKVREALSLAIDRELITEKILFPGSAEPAYGFCIPGLKNNLKSVCFDPSLSREKRHERARQLYKEAGYSEENPLVIDLILPNTPNRKKVGIAVAGMIKKVLGATVNIEAKEFKIYSHQKGQSCYDIYDLFWAFDYNDVMTILERFSGSLNPINAACYHNLEFDKLLEEAQKMSDFNERDKILDKASEIILNDHIAIPLFSSKNYRLVHPRVKGFQESIVNIHGGKYISLDPGKAHITF